MKTTNTHARTAILFLMGLVLFGLLPVLGISQDKDVGHSLAPCIKCYSDLRFDEGISLCKEILNTGAPTNKDQVAVYSILCMLTYAKGPKFRSEAFDYLNQIATLGPCELDLPRPFWPQELRNQWYRVLHTESINKCPKKGPKELKTVAVMKFENASVGEYQEQLLHFTEGLAEFFKSDFAKLTDLDIVEREHLDVIIEEISRNQTSLVESETAVEAGRLLGAQILVFGKFSQIDKKNARFVVWAVDVETGEWIEGVDIEGKPEYFKLERQLATQLAEKLNLASKKEAEKVMGALPTESADAAALYSQGIFFERNYDYAKACECFQKAYDKDPEFAEAKEKLDIYLPLVSSS